MTSVSNSSVQQRGALAHAAGQRVRVEIFEPGQSVAMKQRQRALARRPQRHVLNFHAEDGVVEHRAPGQQQILLQHIADAADGAGGVDAVDQHPAAARPQQSGDDVEDGAFAAARRADQAHETALWDRQRDRRKRVEGARRRPERHADVGNAQFRGRERHAHSARPCHGTDYPIPGGLYRKSHASSHRRLRVDTRFDGSSKAAGRWPGITPSAQAFGSRVPR